MVGKKINTAGKGRNPAKKRCTRSSVQQQEEMDDANSVDTAKQQGNRSNAVHRLHTLFCDITLRVKAAKKGTEELRSQCQTLLRVLQEADESVVLVKYRTDAGAKNARGEWKIGKDVMITNQDAIPSTITALGQYFHRAKPFASGGNVYTKIKLAFDGDFDTLRMDVDAELMELGFKIYPQKLQHYDVRQVGFLHLFHPEGNLEFWTDFFCKQLTAQFKKETKIGLSSRFLYDGRKVDKTGYAKPKSARARAIHVEVVASEQYDVTRAFKEILKGAEFGSRYGEKVRLVPLYDREQSLDFNSKVRRMMVQHGQGIKSMSKGTNYDISYLDEIEKTTGMTLRQMIIGLRTHNDEQLFFTVDESWNRQGFSLYWPTSREEEGRLMQVHLGAALVRTYGQVAKKFFSMEAQQRIDDTTWTEEGIPQGRVDIELNEMLEEGETFTWINTDAIEELNTNANVDTPPGSGTAQPQGVLDTDSVSTFGSRLISPDRSARPARVHTEEDVSVITMDTRVSQMERHMVDLGTTMRQLLEVAQAGRAAIPDRGVGVDAEGQVSSARGL